MRPSVTLAEPSELEPAKPASHLVYAWSFLFDPKKLKFTRKVVIKNSEAVLDHYKPPIQVMG
jgi:hypothetical protein